MISHRRQQWLSSWRTTRPSAVFNGYRWKSRCYWEMKRQIQRTYQPQAFRTLAMQERIGLKAVRVCIVVQIVQNVHKAFEQFEILMEKSISCHLNISIPIVIEVLQKFYTYIVLFNMSNIFHFNMDSSGVPIFPNLESCLRTDTFCRPLNSLLHMRQRCDLYWK